MTEAELRAIVANNIVRCRKLGGQTQAELAEKLNYSDKSVSKWERAEGMPDVYVLAQIAALYGVSVNDLLTEGAPARRLPGRVLIALLAMGLVFLVAAVIFFALRMILPALEGAWLAFMLALPVSSIVMVVFATLWWSYRYQCLAASALIWTLALSVHMMTGRAEIQSIYLVAAVLQVLCVLWYLLLKHRRRGEFAVSKPRGRKD
ncbi:MAG: helix-turn-helix transcriptional regulator [Clostridia bacterium]|nr:helix-turn-helix transcriptional regulator [Clostridia bacterium]